MSIVTPSLNQGAFIDQTIRSIKAQTYPHIEHIVVDGGSTDDTLSVLKRHDGTYDLRWVSGPDSGMYQAINRGMGLSRGDVVAYLNSDDMYFPWSVATAVERLTSAPGVDLVFGDALLLDDTSGRIRPHFQWPFRREYLSSIGSFAQPATWWRRSLIDRVGGFDESLRLSADLDFYLRVADAGELAHVAEFLAVMRLHGAMSTVTQAGRIRAESSAVRARHLAGRRQPVAALAVERARAWASRRAAWLRLAAATTRRPSGPGAWAQFISTGPRVHGVSLALGLLPRLGTRFQWGAISAPGALRMATGGESSTDR